VNVLVVDDSEMFRRLTSSPFASAGWSVGEACDGSEAFNAVRNAYLSGRKYDVVVTDYTMPVMGGVDLIEATRGWESMLGIVPPLPFVVLTAETNAMVALSALAHDHTQYVSKPFEPAELLAVAERAVRSLGQ
jgi:two-component system, chemotaxis family, chemotaxis protein CheY